MSHPHCRRFSPPFPGLATACALLLCAAAPLPAQYVRGRLVDDATGRPIKGGYVALLLGDRTTAASALADADGRFRMRTPEPGRYYIFATHVAYRRITRGPVDVHAGAEVDVEVRLTARPIELDSVLVSAGGRGAGSVLENAGFNARERIGLGRFVTREDIERRNPRELNDVLRVIPGVQVVPTGTGQMDVVLRGGRVARGPSRTHVCYPAVYIDGVRTPSGGRMPTELNQIINPWTVEGIEIYRGPSEVPAIFGGPGSACGAIVLWTRDPAPERSAGTEGGGSKGTAA